MASLTFVEYNLEKLIGHGAFGNVYKASIVSWNSDESKQKGDFVAVKYLQRSNEDEDAWNQTLSEYQNRSKLLKSFKNANLIQYLAIQEQKSQSELEFDKIVIIMEYCPGKIPRWPFCSRIIASYMRQVLVGLSFLHEKGIVHTDLKPDNILIQYLPKLRESVLKICDIDEAVILAENQDISVRGTPAYSSPEIATQNVFLQQKTITQKTDIWSVGCLLVDMFIGYQNRTIRNRKKNIRLGDRGVTGDDILKMIANGGIDGMEEFGENFFGINLFLKRCFQRDPESRLSANDWSNYPAFWSSEYCPVTESSKNRVVEIGYSPISQVFINEYYRDLRKIFELYHTKDKYWDVHIIGRPNLRQLFLNVGHKVLALQFSYAHDWSSELLHGVDLPNLTTISFFNCEGVHFRKGHWKLLPNLRHIWLGRSSISEMQNNFLDEIKSLDYFNEEHYANNSTSILRTFALLQSEDYGWYRSYRIHTSQLKGCSPNWQIYASQEDAVFSAENLRLEKAKRNLEEMEDEFKMPPCSFDDLLDQLDASRLAIALDGPVELCDGLTTSCEVTFRGVFNRNMPINVQIILKETTNLDHLKAATKKISQLLGGHPLTLYFCSWRIGLNWIGLDWKSVWDVILPLQNQIIILKIDQKHVLVPFMMSWSLPNLLEMELGSWDVQISSESFSGFPKLRALMLRTDTFSSIHRNIFDGLKKLQYFNVRRFEDKQLTIQEATELQCIGDKLQSDPWLFEKKHEGEVWEIKKCGHYYRNEVYPFEMK